MDDASRSRAELQEEIRALRAELARRSNPSASSWTDESAQLETVRVPAAFQAAFLRAQHYVARYFSSKLEDPRRSAITIAGERYILVRAASMSVEFFDLVASLYEDRGGAEAHAVASNLLFDVAHSIGKADARAFHARMGVVDPIEKLSAGPIHFSFSGWAFVDIHAESSPTPDEDFYLIYDHPFSFESDAWRARGKRTENPVCIMNAGYSSGWCEESFGIPLVAAEVECQACGDARCQFVMAPPSRIEGHLSRWLEASAGGRAPRPRRADNSVAIPEYFKRKRMEEDLRRSRDELEAFSYSVSHDLRAPLRAIDGYTHILLQDHPGLLDESGRALLSKISRNARHMGSLIDQLLTFSRLSRHGLEIARTDLNAIVRAVVDDLRAAEPARVLDLEIAQLPAIACDAALLRQVFANLLANAFKFTRRKEHPHIAVWAEERRSEIVFHVRDDGAGFDMRYADKLFQVFQRLHAQGEFEGTGVGLAIVQRIVERHGGRVWAEGSEGAGATFSFSMPART